MKNIHNLTDYILISPTRIMFSGKAGSALSFRDYSLLKLHLIDKNHEREFKTKLVKKLDEVEKDEYRQYVKRKYVEIVDSLNLGENALAKRHLYFAIFSEYIGAKNYLSNDKVLVDSNLLKPVFLSD